MNALVFVALLVFAYSILVAIILAAKKIEVEEIPEDQPHDVERIRTGLFPWNYVDVRVPKKEGK